MTVTSKHVFGVLAMAAGLVLLTTSNSFTSPLHPVTASAAGPAWLDHLNAWRANTGTSNLTENATYSAGDVLHATYMVKNDLVTHYETQGASYYTAAGDTAARSSNIYVSSSTSTSDDQAMDWWMGAPFHSMGLMDPRLSQTGYGAYRQVKSGWQLGAAVDVVRGNSFSGGTFPVYFPGNGTTEPLTRYSGYEFPDPLQACAAYSMPTGLPLWVEVGGNVTTAASLDSFTGNGVPLAHCVLDSSTPNLGSYLTERGGVIIIPRAPLQTGVNYVVAVTVNGVPHTWSFSVGPLSRLNPNACTSANGATLPITKAVQGANVTISGAAQGCPTPRYRFWVLPPGGAWQMLQDYSSAASLVWPSPQTAGVYHIELDARDQTSVSSYDAATTLLYTLTGCTSTSMSPGSPSPQAPGTSVTFTATSSACGATEYKFFVQAPGGSWTAQTAYGGATWAWSTTGLAPGIYGVGVWAHTIGSANAYDSYWLGTYTLATTPCTTATLGTATAPPQPPGTPITFTASSCPGAEFKFWLQPKGGSWAMQRDYGSGTWTWNTTGLVAGAYEIGVWERPAGSTSAYVSYGFSTFVLGAGSCNSAALSPNLAAPQAPGATVTFTAISNSCTNAQYEVWLLPPGGSWTAKQAYSPATTWTWNTAGLPLGTYQVGVWAKSSGSANSYDAYFIGTYQLVTGVCTAAGLSASPASPQAAGSSITLTGTATDCASATYAFWELPPPGSTWTAIRGYSATNTFVWNSTGASGPYRFGVWVRQNASMASYESYAIITIWVGT